MSKGRNSLRQSVMRKSPSLIGQAKIGQTSIFRVTRANRESKDNSPPNNWRSWNFWDFNILFFFLELFEEGKSSREMDLIPRARLTTQFLESNEYGSYIFSYKFIFFFKILDLGKIA